jgi:hypothetical protein
MNYRGSLNVPIRLPQDVGPADSEDTRGIPDLAQLRSDVAVYAVMRSRLDDHETRALGCWGLVAKWPESRPIVETLLRSGRADDIEDAAGILGRVGIPDDLISAVVDVIESLPDSSARDSLVASLPPNHPRRVPDATPLNEALRPLAEVPLHGAWEPYTSRIQYIGERFDKVAKAFSKRVPVGGTTRHTGSLAALLQQLDPYWWPSKSLVVETAGKWTAAFSNGHDTYWASILSERMRVRGVVTDFSVDVVRQGDVRNYGNVLFELIDRGKSVRLIQVSRQSSGWEANFLGSQQPFEEANRYEARVKRERFDIGMLNRYCAALGIARSDADFYGPRAILYAEPDHGKTHPLYATAAAWRADSLNVA